MAVKFEQADRDSVRRSNSPAINKIENLVRMLRIVNVAELALLQGCQACHSFLPYCVSDSMAPQRGLSTNEN